MAPKTFAPKNNAKEKATEKATEKAAEKATKGKKAKKKSKEEEDSEWDHLEWPWQWKAPEGWEWKKEKVAGSSASWWQLRRIGSRLTDRLP